MRKATIVFIPEGASQVKQFNVPRPVIFFAIFLVISCFTFIGWIIPNYRMIKAQMLLLAQLKKENARQEKVFLYLAERIYKMNVQIGELQKMDHEIKGMVDYDKRENDTNIQIEGVGGPEPKLLIPDHFRGRSHEELVRLMHTALDNLDNIISVVKEDKFKLHEMITDRKKLLASTPSIWPAPGPISSPFGYRLSPFTGKKEFHEGIDIVAKRNTPVIAPADGIVSSIRRDRWSGNVLSIDHGYGFETIYAHLQKILVKKGQHVKRRETIALVGNTGRSTGPHLHYEVHLNESPVNPLQYVDQDRQSAKVKERE